MVHTFNQFWWRFFPKKKLNQIYISVLLRSFAISLISLFIPIYLYKEQGYTLEQTLLFFVFYAVIFAIFTPIAAKFSARFGMKHCILLSIPFYLLFILFLYLLNQFNIPLILISLMLGLHVAFYWMGLHLVFYHDSDHQHRGEEVGKRQAFTITGTTLGPLMGGMMIKYLGFYSVFMLISVLLFFSAFFLFLNKDNHLKYHFSFRTLLDRKNWENSIFFVSRGIYDVCAGVVWPLFIFFILNDYLSLGIVESLIAGVSAASILIIGKYSDRTDKRKIIRWLTGFEAIGWFFRAAVNTITQVFGVAFFGAIISGIFETPIGALEYDKAKRNVTEYFVSREIFICLGRILLLVFVIMTGSLMGGLILNGITTFAALLF